MTPQPTNPLSASVIEIFQLPRHTIPIWEVWLDFRGVMREESVCESVSRTLRMTAFLAYSESFARVLARYRLSTCLVITVLDAVVARDDGACVGKENHNSQSRLHDAQSRPSSPWIIM